MGTEGSGFGVQGSELETIIPAAGTSSEAGEITITVAAHNQADPPGLLLGEDSAGSAASLAPDFGTVRLRSADEASPGSSLDLGSFAPRLAALASGTGFSTDSLVSVRRCRTWPIDLGPLQVGLSGVPAAVFPRWLFAHSGESRSAGAVIVVVGRQRLGRGAPIPLHGQVGAGTLVFHLARAGAGEKLEATDQLRRW